MPPFQRNLQKSPLRPAASSTVSSHAVVGNQLVKPSVSVQSSSHSLSFRHGTRAVTLTMFDQSGDVVLIRFKCYNNKSPTIIFPWQNSIIHGSCSSEKAWAWCCYWRAVSVCTLFFVCVSMRANGAHFEQTIVTVSISIQPHDNNRLIFLSNMTGF